jgi:hypothetical protein
MPQNVFDSQVAEVTPEIPRNTCVCFDPENVRLEGFYGDQISAYRARRMWVEALERCFLLDLGHDFEVTVHSDLPNSRFKLRCEFVTACARYAFWRLTNQQAPEAQYLIETGHIPRCESHYEEFTSAPDLKPLEEPSEPPFVEDSRLQGNIGGTVRQLLTRIFQSLK